MRLKLTCDTHIVKMEAAQSEAEVVAAPFAYFVRSDVNQSTGVNDSLSSPKEETKSHSRASTVGIVSTIKPSTFL